MIEQLKPSIYKLSYDSKRGYELVYHQPVFEVSGKNYGSMDKHVEIFWTRFSNNESSMGVMLTGSAGSGKTRMAELLSNIAIFNGMAVVLVTEIETDIKLLPFIDSLCNMVIVFDEFSKNFSNNLQDKMLTMFSSVSSNKKLFIITENDRQSISPYIRTRPGRVRYALDYDRMEEEVVFEYCADHNVEESFINEILNIHAKAGKFTFDHLQAMVSEHKALPDYSMSELLDILNLDELVPNNLWQVTKAVHDETGIEWKVATSSPITKRAITNTRFTCWVDLSYTPPVTEGTSAPVPITRDIRVVATNLVKITEDSTYIYNNGEYTIYISKLDK